MKKFIKNLTVYVLILTLLVAFLNAAFVRMDQSDSYGTDKFKELPDSIQICNFGSSHGLYGYNYEDVSQELQCFNFGLSSQTLSYDERLFWQYREHIKEGTIVFLTVSYFSFFGQPETEAADFEAKNKRYYRILPKNLIKNYDKVTEICVNKIPILGVSCQNVIKALLGFSKNDNDSVWQEKATDIDIVAHGQERAEGHIRKNKMDSHGNQLKNQEEIDALYELIQGCKDQGAIPILITPPYLREYTDEVKKDVSFYDEFYGIVDKIVQNTGVPYYDYAFDERFSQNYEWFRDSDHLNKEGARNFVQVLMKEVVEDLR